MDDDTDLALLLREAAIEKLHAEYDGADSKHPQRIDGDLVGPRVRPEPAEHEPRGQQGHRAIHQPDGGQGDARMIAAERHCGLP